ncbi:TetR/AcrR family transcriptional regulator [Arthrobacter oryzae]|uniref:TetR/AcrR family transcriptional regulator n=1 Tax=Arthrobacter oryzae TaxID=409290 RepID=UPI00273CA148|nr:TetR/AcrR family transcriptional regulator [Arthrobacter oryzae]WLQ04936.1 TetR/AcrR family transcriptional regulator [Arthrobacter oryzae]
MNPTPDNAAVAAAVEEHAVLEAAPVKAAPEGEAAISGADARQRVVDTAYELFSRRGIRDVGVNELISRAGVAKATFYRHFSSKDELVLAFLEQRDRHWTVDMIVADARRRGGTPVEQLLAIFDVFGDWFRRDDFEACSFINILLEMGASHPLGRASIDYLARIRGHIQQLAEEAGLRDTEDFSRSWHILMKGSIISATEGDADAAKRAQAMARTLIEQYRPKT